MSEKATTKTKKYVMLATIIVLIIGLVMVACFVVIPATRYKKALLAVEDNNFIDAYYYFGKCSRYKDSHDQLINAKSKEADILLNKGKYDDAYKILKEIGDYDSIHTNYYERAKVDLEEGNYDSAFEMLKKTKDEELINETMYNKAIELEQSNDMASAYLIFEKIPEYKDVNSKITETKPYHLKNQLKKVSVGDTVLFGYNEDYVNASNKTEGIEWLVLEKKKNKMLVISKYGLDLSVYDYSYDFKSQETWETSFIRKRLNDGFIKDTFDSAEQSLLISQEVTADMNPKFSTDPGKDTFDRVFLLSIKEVEKYFKTDKDRVCTPTSHVSNYINNKWRQNSDLINADWNWWLRTPGDSKFKFATVFKDGSISYKGSMYDNYILLRPAMWIDIS